ncbi:MAG: HIT family protein [Patescibacteria group bacterium]
MTTVSEPSIFTKIINREIPADIVYEDEAIIAFLTIEPVNPGHTLIVPKVPFVNVLDGDDAVLGQMMVVARKISQALMDAKLAEGINLIMNNGAHADQEVFHAHLHVVPRLSLDQAYQRPKHHIYEPGQSTTIAATIKNALPE